MKKTLILVRHAHTYDAAPGQPDIERELTPDGQDGARHAAEWLLEQGTLPSRILASSAKRTQATAAIFSEVLFKDATRFEKEIALYGASEEQVLDCIHENCTDEQALMLVGHNPTFTQLAIRLGATSVAYLPPASIVLLSFEIESWTELQLNHGKLLATYLPDEE